MDSAAADDDDDDEEAKPTRPSKHTGRVQKHTLDEVARITIDDLQLRPDPAGYSEKSSQHIPERGLLTVTPPSSRCS